MRTQSDILKKKYNDTGCDQKKIKDVGKINEEKY